MTVVDGHGLAGRLVAVRRRRIAAYVGALALLAFVFGAGLWIVLQPIDHRPSVRWYLGFAGDGDRLAALSRRVSPDQLRGELWREMVFAVCALAVLLLVNRGNDGFRIRRFRSAKAAAITLAVLAAAADLVGNAVALSSLRTSAVGGVTFTSNRAAVVVTACNALLWPAAVAAVSATLLRLTSKVLPGTVSVVVPPGVAAAATAANAQGRSDDSGDGGDGGGGDPPLEYGICCSGGGIRAASYALGVLLGLEADGRPRVANARFLSAVSGGNYTATGWMLCAAQRDVPTGAAADLLAHLQQGEAHDVADPLATSTTGGPRAPLERDHTARQRHRYLKNGRGGLPVALAWAAGIVALHAFVLLALTFAFSWPFGVLIGHQPFHPEFRTEPFPSDVALGWRDWFPVIALLGLAVVVFAVGSAANVRRPAFRAGRYIAIAAFVSLAFLVAMPWALTEVPKLLSGTSASTTPTAGATGLFGAAIAALGGWVWAIAKGKLRKSAPYLGGVVMLLLLALFGGKVANDVASGSGWLDLSPWVWGAVVVALLAVYLGPGVQWASFRPVYTRGLRGSFGAQATAVTWTMLRDRSVVDGVRRLPELVVCCAAQRVGLSPNGIPAQSFTVTPMQVRLEPSQGDGVATEAYIDQIRSLKLQSTLSRPDGWMAISGAAFASAMGRESKGTTNAVLAGLGINLGVWLPSPRRMLAGVTGFPRVRMGYYLKEVFGLYDREDDHVFVADGGQWENLGMVELLRRNCKLVICIDASGDLPGSFGTLRQGLAMALTELETVRKFDLTALEASNTTDAGLLPPTSVVRIGVQFTDGSSGEIIYANSRIAADQDIDVRRFARLDRKFPHYSTGDQFLDDQQFEFLVAAGNGAGRTIATMLDKNHLVRH